jgi:translation initiation factor IF-2
MGTVKERAMDSGLSQSAGAKIIGFNVGVSGSVAKLAETEKITIRNYKIIYELLDEVEKLLHPASLEIIDGKATILAEFKYENLRVAGCKAIEGEIKKNCQVRIMRGPVALGETRFKSLRIGKAEVTSVKKDQEFGAIFLPYLDFKVGDVIIAFHL